MEDNLLQLDEFYLDLQKDGRRINLLDLEAIRKRPFPGLRPFKTSESQLFFGREGQTEEIMKILRRNRFVAVLGNSGSGKSSLVRAGVLPSLYSGYLGGVGSNWSIAICRPGKNPIVNMAVALSSCKIKSNEEKLISREFNKVLPMIQKNSFGILEYEKYLNFEKEKEDRENLLIVVDQFEELFRFKREYEQHDHASTRFVNQLLSACQNKNAKIFVIITMRSEFLGDCVQFRGLPEIINTGQYLVPRLKRNEIKQVIEEPLKLANEKINPSLVNRLVDEVGDDMDQLPLLQHVMMRTYNYWLTKSKDEEIDHKHYEFVGTIHEALGFHASEKINCLDESEQLIAKIIFQRLTDKASDERGIRRPTSFEEIIGILKPLKESKSKIKKVINFLRDENTSFIMPPANTRLQNELILDISHESLMRNWPLLKKWIEEEVDNARLYKRLNTRRLYNEPIQGSLLKVLTNWNNNFRMNAVWASRYHRSMDDKLRTAKDHEVVFEANMAFLRECNEEERKKLSEEERKRTAKYRMARAAAVGLLFLLAGSVWIGVKFKEQRDIAKINEQKAMLAEKKAKKEEENAVTQKLKAEEEKRKVEEEKKKVEEAEKEAQLEKQHADRERKKALEARRRAMKQKDQIEKEKQRAEEARKFAWEQKQLAENEKQKTMVAKDSIYRLLLMNNYLQKDWFRLYNQDDRNYIVDTFELLKKKSPVLPNDLENSFEELSKTMDKSLNLPSLEKLAIAKRSKFINSNPITQKHLNKLLEGKLNFENKIVLNQTIYNIAETYGGEVIFFSKDSIFKSSHIRSEFEPIYVLSNNETPIGISEEDGLIYLYNTDISKNNLVIIDTKGNIKTTKNFSPDLAFISEKAGIPYKELNLNLENTKISPDGSQIAFFFNNHFFICNVNGKIKKDAATGQSSPITHLCFSIDGSKLVTTTDNDKVTVWNTSKLEKIGNFYCPKKIRSVEISPKSDQVLVSTGNKAIIYTNNGKQVQVFNHKGQVFKSIYTSNGEQIITAEKDKDHFKNSFNLWMANGKKTNSFTWHDYQSSSFVYNVGLFNNNHVVTSVDNEVYLWNLNAKQITENQIGTTRNTLLGSEEDQE